MRIVDNSTDELWYSGKLYQLVKVNKKHELFESFKTYKPVKRIKILGLNWGISIMWNKPIYIFTTKSVNKDTRFDLRVYIGELTKTTTDVSIITRSTPLIKNHSKNKRYEYFR